MLVTLSGIVTLVSDMQPLKAEPPMLVTLSGIATLVSDMQPLKAEPPMLVTVISYNFSGITISSQFFP